ncbi:MAG: aminotransferase class III-fold pyridoxal phosphate-dependent enzyme [Ilumatobacter sp.]|uniref:aspartate aminotransferase family protein n=1 Tax=Ilumatobacter sp. TaxID=1967498 RepID=UPI002603456C|nr:aminotransferase class III-fold pyridoxal phosphate-dependent enzyme [Ilumatobacter sp.]MDJ0769802.1 aminotransferase class III-fold pyridoxal phosphate-dependent enzyme [Ilumatobacter sp.]
MSHLSNVWFKVTDLQIATGRGCRVTTVDGHDYLDFAAGIAVNSTGHCHPKVTAAISEQAERLIHGQVNTMTHDRLEPLAAKLADITPGPIDTFFFASSGAEITEAAVKLAKRATGRPNVIVFQGSFHGRTHLAMAMTTSKTSYRAGYAPLPSGVFVAPFPDPLASDQETTINASLRSFDRLLVTQTAPGETAAVVMEPVLGEGGYIPAPQAFVEGIAERCREHGILFVADEVQSGFGRTGEWFAVDRFEVEPDIICMAKGIASGFPFAALGTRRELDDLWPTGSHGGTYGGNPIGCAAALATIEVMSEPGFLDNVRARGNQLRDGLSELKERFPELRQVRGPGLMVASSFDHAERVPPVLEHCLHDGHLILMSTGTDGNIIRWMPPLVVTAAEIDEAVDAFADALKATA